MRCCEDDDDGGGGGGIKSIVVVAEAVSASLGMYLVASAATSWFLKRAMAWSGPGARHAAAAAAWEEPNFVSSSSSTSGAE